MVRLMYGGRTSIYIGVMAAMITTFFAVAVGLAAGYWGGWTDSVLSRTMDVVWAFPVLLLGIALGTALSVGGLQIGPLSVPADSLWIPILIIGFVYVPYMARPIRGEVLALREKEFVEAAVAQGKGPLRIMFTELLPNLFSTIIVFFTLNIANNMLLESALSFLGAGVKPPNSSWGTMISDGQDRLVTAPHLTIVPGVMIVLTVLALNVFGDGLRDALNPQSEDQDGAPDGAAMGRFIVRRLIGMVRGPVRHLRPRLPDLQRDPELRPRAADRRQERRPAADRPDQQGLGLQRPVAAAVRDADEEDRSAATWSATRTSETSSIRSRRAFRSHSRSASGRGSSGSCSGWSSATCARSGRAKPQTEH